ncbi:Uncharacterised protein [Serratia fonticola]|uniref:Uncharacterized protein n=1 Tax=Serratia fonticola TaxID=47917 RepID=A0A4U9TS55_SERFO|nr:Uncharacterised protein [Serratia fonticola]
MQTLSLWPERSKPISSLRKWVSVDQQNRVVVLAGAEGHNVSFKLTDQAKDLTHLKAGDTIQATIVRSRIVKLDTDLDKAAPAITSLYEESNATKEQSKS